MDQGAEALAEIRAHERECTIRYEYIEKTTRRRICKIQKVRNALMGRLPFYSRYYH
jgi:hypothetical protein